MLALLKAEPDNDVYWTNLYFYTGNEKALFKAYDINPCSSLVLNSLISLYFKKQEWKKFFKFYRWPKNLITTILM